MRHITYYVLEVQTTEPVDQETLDNIVARAAAGVSEDLSVEMSSDANWYVAASEGETSGLGLRSTVTLGDLVDSFGNEG